MAKEVISYRQIITPDHEQEFNVLLNGAAIGSVFYDRENQWGAETNFDAIATSGQATRQQAAKRLVRRFRKGYEGESRELEAA